MVRLIFLLFVLAAADVIGQGSPEKPLNIELTNGYWFDGNTFKKQTVLGLRGTFAFYRGESPGGYGDQPQLKIRDPALWRSPQPQS